MPDEIQPDAVEVVPAEVVLTDAEAEAEAQAQFASGYSLTPTPTEAIVPAPEVVANDPEPVVAAVVPEVVEPKLAQVTEAQLANILASVNSMSELKATMEKQFGTAFGKLGGFERTIKELQTNTEVGKPITVTEDDLAEIKLAYPELTTKLSKDLTNVLSRLKGTGGSATAAIDVEQAIATRLVTLEPEIEDRLERKLATKSLTRLHPDWQNVVGPVDSGSKFREWLQSQPASYAKQIEASIDPIEISDAITTFKKTQTPAPKPAVTPKSDAVSRKERLAEAVNPRGGAQAKPSVKTPEEEFAEGYQKALQG